MLATVLAGPEADARRLRPDTLLPNIGCPTLLLQADPLGPLQGGVIRNQDVELGLRLLPNAHHVRLNGVGHPLNETPAVLAAIAPDAQTSTSHTVDTVRKIILQLSMSVDGYFEGPGRELDWHQVDDELHRHFN